MALAKLLRPILSVAATSVLCLTVVSAAAGQADDAASGERVGAELAAGEFSTVRQRAETLEDPASRDEVLGKLAVAQSLASVPLGSAESLRAIGDVRVRQQTLETIRPGGGEQSGGQLAGGAQADFESLIQLIQSTVAPNSWDALGGPGSIAPFPGGVYVDPSGVMRRIEASQANATPLGTAFDQGRRPANLSAAGDVRAESDLRYVSLPRLEREIELRHLTGQPLDDAMRALAGLRRVRYVFVYPATGDVVLAGPAGDWQERNGRIVSSAAGEPVVLLEDLVLLMRRARDGGAEFGCSITPKQENLAKTQQYLAATTARPLRPGERNRWIAGIREALGRQEIDVFGLDPRTRVAQVLVEADYHMKLIGMGLEEGVPGVESYLDTVPLGPNNPAPPMSVLRWWFTLNYDSIATTREGLAYEIRGPGVRVLSENELLTQRGERVHTGMSDELTARFAASFTRHFDALAMKYPIYAELRTIFDLALVVALLEEHGLYDRSRWHASALLDPSRIRVAPLPPPREVDSVVNHRTLGGKYILVGVSGGVSVDTSDLVRADSLEVDDYGQLRQDHRPLPADLRGESWWWDRR